MEVLNDRSSLLTNQEVLQLLKEIKHDEESKPKAERSKLLNTVVYETTKYLSTQPAAVQSPEMLAGFIRAVAPFKLTAAETMQLINLRPTSITEIQMIVEESEERFKTEEQLNNLLDVIVSNLPANPAQLS